MTMLPTPDAKLSGSGPDYARMTRERSGGPDLITALAIEYPRDAPAGSWGTYETAVRRWEAVTRPAPPPTMLGPRGAYRLSPLFTEWMMGLPAGWVTDAGLSRREQLTLLGNGVVPLQAEHAISGLLRDVAA